MVGRKESSPAREKGDVHGPESFSWLDQCVEVLHGVGPKMGAILRNRGYERVRDLLWVFPFRYEDRRFAQHIRTMVPGQKVQGRAKVKATRDRYSPGAGRWIYEVTLQDRTGEIKAKWFLGGKKRRSVFRVGEELLFSGRLQEFQGRREIYHPDIEKPTPKNRDLTRFGRILPLYPKIEGIPGATLRRIVTSALSGLDSVADPLPLKIRVRHMFASLPDALRQVHAPDAIGNVSRLGTSSYLPLRRLIFDEFFTLQMALHLRRRANQKDIATSFPYTQRNPGPMEEGAPIPFDFRAADGTGGDLQGSGEVLSHEPSSSWRSRERENHPCPFSLGNRGIQWETDGFLGAY